MAKQIVKVYPGERFGAVSFLTYEKMKEKSIASPRNQTVVLQLGFIMNFNETEHLQEINDIEFQGYSGWSAPISNAKLAERCDMSERSIIYALNELEENKIIKKEKVGKCFRCRFLTFKPEFRSITE